MEYDSEESQRTAHCCGALARLPNRYEGVAVSRVRVCPGGWVRTRFSDTPQPLTRHNAFPYVPFWGKREDRTGVPFGLARGMIYLQDQINALHSKSQWMMAARRVVRTAMARCRQRRAVPATRLPGKTPTSFSTRRRCATAAFSSVETDLELNAAAIQPSRRHSRDGLRRVGGIYSEFQGQNSNTTQSGVQFNSQVEQSNQSLADILDNFKTARMEVGDQLLSMIIEDMIGKQESVILNGKGLLPDQDGNPQRASDRRGNGPAVPEQRRRARQAQGRRSATCRPRRLSSSSNWLRSARRSSRRRRSFQPIITAVPAGADGHPDREDLVQAIKEAGNNAERPSRCSEQIKQAVEQALIKQKPWMWRSSGFDAAAAADRRPGAQGAGRGREQLASKASSPLQRRPRTWRCLQASRRWPIKSPGRQMSKTTTPRRSLPSPRCRSPRRRLWPTRTR
jgi:hypothetical protein